MKLGVIADVHGNDVALRAVLDDAARHHVDRWWVLGDLVLFGPRPAEVLDRLRGLPDVSMLRGNTDRYVLTGEQPAPHATAADAVGRPDGRRHPRPQPRQHRDASATRPGRLAAPYRRRPR
jgi:predicted phosphodiesterase